MSRRRQPCSAALVRVRDKARVADGQSQEEFKDCQIRHSGATGPLQMERHLNNRPVATGHSAARGTTDLLFRSWRFLGAGPLGHEGEIFVVAQGRLPRHLPAARGLTILRD